MVYMKTHVEYSLGRYKQSIHVSFHLTTFKMYTGYVVVVVLPLRHTMTISQRTNNN